jgi:integrase
MAEASASSNSLTRKEMDDIFHVKSPFNRRPLQKNFLKTSFFPLEGWCLVSGHDIYIKAKLSKCDFPLDLMQRIEKPVSVPGDQMATNYYHDAEMNGGGQPAPQDAAFHQHTLDHINCPACKTADEALQGGVNLEVGKMPFREAGCYWMRLRNQDTGLKPRAKEATACYLTALEKYFGGMRLCDITPGAIRGYQMARLANSLWVGGVETHPWKRKCENGTVNHELVTLAQLMRHCNLWYRIQEFYFPLSVPQWSPRTVLTEEQEEHLWNTVSKCPEAALAYHVATITNNTTASGIELRGLRMSGIRLRPEGEISEIYIPEDAVKNESRPRSIALNAAAKWAVEQIYKRALKNGSYQNDHYVFAFRVKPGQWDPTRPASRGFLRKSWGHLRRVSGFKDLRPHDLRHHCITKMLENDVSESTVKGISGHVTQKMLDYYAHTRVKRKHAAVVSIDRQKFGWRRRDHGLVLALTEQERLVRWVRRGKSGLAL